MSTMIRNSLRRLTGKGGVFTNINFVTRTHGSYAFPRILLFRLSSGYTESKGYYHAHAESKGGSSLGKEFFERPRSITHEDPINLPELLFTENRDYLIRNNNQRVKADWLVGKVIGVYFMPLSCNCPQHTKWHTTLLKDVYDDLQPANNFEVVLVASTDLDGFEAETPVHSSVRSDAQKYFEDSFSYMPWTAIPFSDVTSRKHMQITFGVYETWVFPILFIIDSTGMVLQCRAFDILQDFGALGHPFSDERISFLMEEDDAIIRQPSLKTLLASPGRDYVISNKGDKVPIQSFEDKIVALYFFHPDYPDFLTEELRLAYEESAKMKEPFEVVLIYIREPIPMHDWKSEESFWEKFKTMPWLALPFKDLSYKKLRRVFEYPHDNFLGPTLVIFGPHADYIEPYGCFFLEQYKIPAYPFTRKKAAELEYEKVKELKLEMLWELDTVFRRSDGSQVPLSQLSGKRVMLVLESSFVTDDVSMEGSYSGSIYTKLLIMLKERYMQTKGSKDEFEVIRIFVNNTESPIRKHLVGDMPWLVSPASDLIHDIGSSSYFWYDRSIDYVVQFFLPIIAFDVDGRLVRKTLHPTFEDTKFPFYNGDLKEEMLHELVTIFDLKDWDFQNTGRIYSWA